MNDKRPFDWLLDGVAPFYGCLIGLTLAMTLIKCCGG
jgi:hypothetical protein